ncbi:MAG: multiheme c-type cytochrome [Nitrospiraceae bacterium]|nr:multiheme c-type cytochrome [Nitrospiraceae bacterium]
MTKRRTPFTVFFALIFLAAAAASGSAHQFPAGAEKLAKSEECSGCHAAIYTEWTASMHANSSPFKDNAHNAVRLKFAASLKQMGKTPSYHCANCHTPMADNIADLMSGKAQPDSDNWTHTEGTGCSFCHRIESIVPGKEFNQYVLNKDGSFYSSNPSGKAPHKTAKSALFSSGEVCMGCHSHMRNSKGAPICVMDEEGASNCLTCHMPEAEGSPAAGSEKKTHFSHALPGGHDIDMLRKAVSLDMSVDTSAKPLKVAVTLKNISAHTFPSTMPMRLAFLKLTAEDSSGRVVWTNIKESPMEDMQSVLVKMFKAGEEKGVAPWKAEAVAMDTRLKKGEERKLSYTVPSDNIKTVSVSLIYRLFAPPAMKMMGIPADGKNDKVYMVIKKKVDL